MKNYAKSHNSRKTKTGWKTLLNMCRRIEEILGLKRGTIMTHPFRRSGATALADAGASVIQLKRAGRWSSQKIVEGYIEHCLPEKRTRAQMLTGDESVEVVSVS